MLASGRESDFFIDCKQTVLTAEGHALVGELMLDALASFARLSAVAGVELGGCPLASAVALRSFRAARPSTRSTSARTRRTTARSAFSRATRTCAPGARVAIVEDVMTTGGSTLKAVEKLRAAGYDVVGVVALVDRLEGGRENLEAAGLQFVALYTRHDFTSEPVPQED